MGCGCGTLEWIIQVSILPFRYIYLFTHLSISINLCIHFVGHGCGIIRYLYIYLFSIIYISTRYTYLYFHLSISPSIFLSFFYLSIHLSIKLSIYPSIFLYLASSTRTGSNRLWSKPRMVGEQTFNTSLHSSR